MLPLHLSLDQALLLHEHDTLGASQGPQCTPHALEPPDLAPRRKRAAVPTQPYRCNQSIQPCAAGEDVLPSHLGLDQALLLHERGALGTSRGPSALPTLERPTPTLKRLTPTLGVERVRRTLALTRRSCCTSVARSARSFSRWLTLLRSTLISCTTCARTQGRRQPPHVCSACYHASARLP